MFVIVIFIFLSYIRLYMLKNGPTTKYIILGLYVYIYICIYICMYVYINFAIRLWTQRLDKLKLHEPRNFLE